MRAIATALEAKKVRAGSPRTDRLEFDIAVLEQKLGPVLDSDNGAKIKSIDSIATKVFVADGEGEFYLNLDPKDGVGEISIKDEDYGDIVVKELSRVFWTGGKVPPARHVPPPPVHP